jgi:hypothetical protein
MRNEGQTFIAQMAMAGVVCNHQVLQGDHNILFIRKQSGAKQRQKKLRIYSKPGS